jgi:hypothetical protein
LPALIFGGAKNPPSIHEAMMETAAIVIVWLVVIVFTRRIVQRLFYFEGFLRVCAWCRKIGYEDGWTTVEEYFSRGFAIKTSHSMCLECQAKWVEETKKNAA